MRPVISAASVAASTRTMSSPRSPGVSDGTPVRTESTKARSWAISGSWNATNGDTMSPVR
ncbi:hypothetical protein BJF90_28290 [Pseudonocardia sp. CNS-004]|nr:hypothetical protein BJF90_28290 [Pseudonocardia sp. CNS-004]